MTTDQNMEILRREAEKLMEHFSSVQILASRVDADGSTHMFTMGRGDWYARQGLAHEFISRERAETNANSIGVALRPPDPGDDWKNGG